MPICKIPTPCLNSCYHSREAAVLSAQQSCLTAQQKGRRDIKDYEKDLELSDVKVEQVVLNQSGKRAIRMDAWTMDTKTRQFNGEMQNDTKSDDLRKRARFITQEDIFGKDRVIMEKPEILVSDSRIEKLYQIVGECQLTSKGCPWRQ